MFQTHGLSIRAMRLACCRIVCLLLVSNREGRELHAEHRLDQINSLLPHIFAGRRSGRHSPESAALNSTHPATSNWRRLAVASAARSGLQDRTYLFVRNPSSRLLATVTGLLNIGTCSAMDGEVQLRVRMSKPKITEAAQATPKPPRRIVDPWDRRAHRLWSNV
jgi:hypothetical protein